MLQSYRHFRQITWASRTRYMQGGGHILGPMDRMTIGRMQNPIRGFLHGGAAVATLAGTIYLVDRAWGRPGALIGALIFGFALLLILAVAMQVWLGILLMWDTPDGAVVRFNS